ncbi:cytochrome P450 [Klebsiella quasipneumoniae]|jgi:Cytochrome P450|uniref:cytochrome P450 n=1 Tax=Enterobacter TaxID=547 RepID=UPI00075154F5|nr:MULTISPECIES: cytochrome P450 [Enterobacter]KUQ99910.1 hypothetical protein AWI31_12125 [Enterobacter hormaechei subsp. xiangfangensis]KZP65696.1 hypothetical protein A3462_05710 [Enterobacter bugandensis]
MKWIYKKVKEIAIARRECIFTGDENVLFLPDKDITCSEIKMLLKTHQYKGKNVTRKLIEFFHSPVDCHPENMASDNEYADLMKIIYPLLAIKKTDSEKIIHTVLGDTPSTVYHDKKSGYTIIRNETIPVLVQFFHLRLFGRYCDNKHLKLLSKNVILFKRTISFIDLPNSRLRARVLNYLRSQCDDETMFRLTGKRSSTSDKEKISKVVMGVFFHTGVIQISEFVAHTIIALSQNQAIQTELKNRLDDDVYLDCILKESLRLYPMFGITNRITEEIHTLNNGKTIAKGTNIIFSFVKCHELGFLKPEGFKPERWLSGDAEDTCYMPFGVGPRMCPAQRMAINITGTLIRILLEKHRFYSSIEHDRPLTGGGLVYYTDDIKLSDFNPALIYISFREAIIQLYYNVRVILNCFRIKHGNYLTMMTNDKKH